MAITAQEATIIVAIIGAVVTYVTFLMEKSSEPKIELRKIKEKQYYSEKCLCITKTIG